MERKIILIGILMFTMFIIIFNIYFLTTLKTEESFTEFYMLNQSGYADRYQTRFKVDTPANMLLGVTNYESIYTNYTIKIVVDKDILSTKNISLRDRETWEGNMTFIPHKNGNNLKMTFFLFKENNFQEPYRRLYLWINVND